MADNKDESGQAPIRKRPSGLGRGLNALFGDVAVEAPVLATPGSAARAAPPAGDSVQHIPVGAIRPLPGQPRRHFDENAIAEIADSIGRSEERRVGKECVRQCRSRWSPYNSKKKKDKRKKR